MSVLFGVPDGARPATGRRTALPLVLVHGWGMNAAVWGEFGEALGEDAELYRLELPGHGRNPWTGPADLHHWAQAAWAAVPRPAVWLGWSLGALVVLRVALDHPEAVHRVVLLAGTPRFIEDGDWPHAMAPRMLERFGRGLAADPTATLERFLALQVIGARDASTTLRRLKVVVQAAPPPHPQALALGLKLLRETDLRRELDALAVPSLWLLGERDALVPAGMRRELIARLPQACVEVVEGAGHAFFLSHAPGVSERVRAFLGPPRG